VCKDFHMDEDLEVVKGVQMTIRTTKRWNLAVMFVINTIWLGHVTMC
jgi:hypothetical protein